MGPKISRRPGNCAKTLDFLLMHRSHDAEISGPANGRWRRRRMCVGRRSLKAPLLRPSHYRVRSSSKCESLVWKFLVGNLQEICRDTLSLVSNVDGTCCNMHIWFTWLANIYFDQSNSRNRKSGWRRVSSHDDPVRRYFWNFIDLQIM